MFIEKHQLRALEVGRALAVHDMKKVHALLAAFLLGAGSAIAGQAKFYIGTYTDHSSSRGIYQGSLDTSSGKLGSIVLSARAVDPSFLALRPDGRILYAAEEKPGEGAIEAFGRETTGDLIALNKRSAGGNGTCYIAVDPSGQDALVANYGSGSIACFHLHQDGSVGARTALVQFTGTGPDTQRQEGPHAHCVCVSQDDAFAYACDLGSDHVWMFKLDPSDGKLTSDDPPFASVPPGAGARHLVFSPDGKFLYVSNEMGHSVTVFTRNLHTGKLTPIQTASSLPAGVAAGETTTAEIVLHPSGKWLYVSNRGINTISVFAIDSAGRLTLIQNISARVSSPRSFSIEPSGEWMLTAGQNDNHLAVLRIDPLTGRLSATNESAPVPSPVCVLFVPGT